MLTVSAGGLVAASVLATLIAAAAWAATRLASAFALGTGLLLATTLTVPFMPVWMCRSR